MEKIGDILSHQRILERIAKVATEDSSSADLAITTVCPRCNDAGYLRAEVPVGHADFGQIVPCPCRADEIKELRAARLRELSNLGPLSRLTFERLSPEGRRTDLSNRQRFRSALEEARRFAAEPRGWLVLLGPPGCGKTHLAAAIANQRLAEGEPAIFSVVPDLLDHLRLTYSPQSEVSYDDLFESVKSTGLLILDDLGAQSSTPWAEEKLFQLLNHRYNVQLPTVITTNYRLDQLEERLRSRLTDGALSTVCLVESMDPSLLSELGGGLGLERLRGMTFETFDVRAADFEPSLQDNLRNALAEARRFAAEPEGWLTYVGLPSTGKTHLAVAIANELLAKGRSVCFVVVPDLLDHLRMTFAPDSQVRYDRLFEAIRTAPVLVLDDLAAQVSTPWAQEKLFQIFNYRYNAKLPTVVTTNILVEQQEARVSSRLLDQRISTLFGIDTPPYRTPAGPRSSSRKQGGGRGRRVS